MIPIGNVDWNAIRAEYIGGGISQRKIAKKYGVSENTLMRKANKEKWNNQRDAAYNETTAVVQQKTAEAAADFATIATDLRKSLLLRLQKIERKFPIDATEVRTKQGNSTAIFRIRDLTAAYKDLTDGVQTEVQNNELLRALLELERGAAND